MMDIILAKNKKYKDFYKPNDLYWGIGIENEIYFMTEKQTERTGAYIKKNHRRERYSIDYNTSYNQDFFNSHLNTIFNDEDVINIPNYLNAHTFLKTDIHGEHRTTYSYNPAPNPKFDGMTVYERLCEFHDIFKADLESKYTFDGDTIEFMTQQFYKTTVQNSVQELREYKTRFIGILNDFMEKNKLPKLFFPKINYGLVHFKTNPYHVGIFNNGTYHINLTIPTQLNNNSEIADPDRFNTEHQNAIRMIQWIEPLLIAIYGTPDFLSYRDNQKYCSGSLRLGASRYIGIGIYDSDKMIKGKLLYNKRSEVPLCTSDSSWHKKIFEKTAYLASENIGYDFNYAKYHNSGIEFRILDYFPEEALPDLIDILILLLDHSLHYQVKSNAQESNQWNNMVSNTLINGYNSQVPYQYISEMHLKAGFPQIMTNNMYKYFECIVDFLYQNYQKSWCSLRMSPKMRKPQIYCINQFMWDHNFLQYIPCNSSNTIRLHDLYDYYSKLSDPDGNYILDLTNKIENLVIKTELHKIIGLSLDQFYQRILEIKKNGIFFSNYIL